jgi:hypothetical protein
MAENSTRPMKEMKPIVFLSSRLSLPLADSLFFQEVARKNEWQPKPTFFNPPKNLQTPRCFFELELRKKDTKDHRWKSSQGGCDHHK